MMHAQTMHEKIMIESHILVMIKIFKYFATLYNFHLIEREWN